MQIIAFAVGDLFYYYYSYYYATDVYCFSLTSSRYGHTPVTIMLNPSEIKNMVK